jgi:predicted TIM-barrel fold metal-dependent hydrolase
LGITYLADPQEAAAEVRRNAARGFRSLTLPERPHRIGLPSIFTDYWDPVLAACEETDTVISLHVGSSGLPSDFAPEAKSAGLSASLFGQLSLTACAEWIWSGLPARFPGIKIALSEGGIGWVAMLLDRLETIVERSGYGKDYPGDLTPAEVLHRNFWFCTIDDPKTIVTRDVIGVDRIMVEVDYPHGDSTWPDTQSVIERVWGALPVDDLRKMTHQNAADLFRWPLPEVTFP